MFFEAFQSPSLNKTAAKSSVSFVAEAVNPVSTTSHMFDGCTYLKNIDLDGLGPVDRFSSVEPSMSYMFQNCKAITAVGYASTPGTMLGGISKATLILSEHWKNKALSNVTTMIYMFNGCTAIRGVYMQDICTNDGDGVNMSYMFQGLTNMTIFAMVPSDPGSDSTGSASNVSYMFQNCSKVEKLDLTGLGTSQVAGTYSSSGSASTYMYMMFNGCTKLCTDPGTVEAADNPLSISIGAQFTKVLNGFFWYQEQARTNPTYMIYANIHVLYGGPMVNTYLMERPEYQSYVYTGTIYFDDFSAWQNKDVWLSRNYLNYSSEFESDDSGQGFGEMVTGGLIGYVGTVDGIYYNGTDVSWAIRKNKANVFTLVIYSTAREGCLPIMRDLGATDGTYAPWNYNASQAYARQFTQAVVMPGVIAHGSLTQMFMGCSNLKSADLRNLSVPGTAISTMEMFKGCTEIVSLGYAPEGGGTLPSVVLPAKSSDNHWDTTNVVTANAMFQGCTKLKSVELEEFASGTGANLAYMFYQCPSLTDVKLTRVGDGAYAILSYMFSEVCTSNTYVTSSAQIKYSLTDVGVGGDVTFDHMFYKAFNATNLNASSANVEIVFSATPADPGYNPDDPSTFDKYPGPKPATNMESMFECGSREGSTSTTSTDSSHIKRLDLRGLPGIYVNKYSADNAKMDYIFRGLVNITSVGYDTSAGNKIILREGWDLSQVTSMERAFVDMIAMKTCELRDWCTGSSVDMYRMFWGCRALTDISWLRSANGPRVGSTYDMRQMFAYCTSLKTIDFTGFGTGSMMGDAEQGYNFSANGMAQLFHYSSFMWTSTSAPTYTGTVKIGPAFTKVLAAFFCNSSTDGTVGPYINNFNLVVYGGPTATNNLIECPTSKSNGLYNGLIDLADAEAIGNKQVWVQRNYTNLAYSGLDYIIGTTGKDEYGSILIGAFIGETSEADPTGTSVAWAIRKKNGVGTLVIYPFNGVAGTIRAFGQTDTTYAPWNRSARYDGVDYSGEYTQVKIYPSVMTSGSLELMFEGSSNVTSMDLSGLVVTGRTQSMYRMFYGCSKLTTVGVKGSGSTLMLDTQEWDTSNLINCSQMFQNCTELVSLNLSNLATGPTAKACDMTYFASGCQKLKTLILTNFGTGDGVSLAYAFYQDYALTTVTLNNVGSGRLANLTYMFSQVADTNTNITSGSNAVFRLTDVGTGGLANMGYMFHSAFGASYLTGSNVSVTFDYTVIPQPAATYEYMFYYNTYLKRADLRGLPGLAEQTTATASTPPSMQFMFNYCTTFTSAGYDTSAGNRIIFREDWDLSKNTSMYFAFSSCSKLQTAEFRNFITSPSVDTFRMFRYDSALTSVAFTTTDPSTIGSSSDMRGMFNDCTVLRTIDFTGFGTNAIGGDGDQGYDWTTGKQQQMFYGCTALTNASNLAGNNFTIGPKTNKILLGFLQTAYANSTTRNQIYANLYVYGGPTSEQYLVPCPSTYTGTVHLMNSTAIDNRTVWANRGYTNMTYEGLEEYVGTVGRDTYGTFIIGGYIGASVEGDEEGKSVSWALRKANRSDATGTLLIYPTNIADPMSGITGTSGTMRRLGTSSGTYAPWNGLAEVYGTAYGAQIKEAIIYPGITAQGSLVQMFEGMPNLVNAYMQDLNVTSATDSFYRMFAGCTSIKTVGYDRAQGGAVLSRAWNTNGVVMATQMFQGCTGLTSATIGDAAGVPGNGFCNGPDADLSYMFQGCTNLTGKITLLNIGNGTDASGGSMFQGLTNITSLELKNSFNGFGANLSYMFQGCTKLKNVDMADTGNGDEANLTYMFNQCYSLIKGTFNKVAGGARVDVSYMMDAIAWNGYVNAGEVPQFTLTDFGIGGDSNMAALFRESFRDTDLQNVDGSIVFVATRDKLPSVSFDRMFSAVNTSNAYYLKRIDCRGLPGLAVPSNPNQSDFTNHMQSMFFSNNNITKVGYDDTCTVRLDENWDLRFLRDTFRMFYDCDSLTEVELRGFVTNTDTGVSMSHMFGTCDKLTSVKFVPSATYPTGFAKSMVLMFENCPQLTSVDFTGFGTYDMEGDYNTFKYSDSHIATTAVANGMCNVFRNATKMVNGTGSVTIGPDFTKILPGFFEVLSTSGTYASTVNMKVVLTGGPGSAQYLAVAPAGWTKSADKVTFVGATAEENRTLWIERGYIDPPAAPPADTRQYIGAADDGQNGHSVHWYVTGTTLTIEALDGIEGTMRSMGTDATNRAPWNALANSTVATTVTTVTIKGQITARGDLAQLFYGMTKLNNCDLRNLVVTGDTTNMFQMFYNCTAIASVGYTASTSVKLMPTGTTKWDTSGVTNMSQMFYGCTALTSLHLDGFANNAAVDISGMMGTTQTPNLVSLALGNFGNRTDISFANMFQLHTKLTNVTMNNVGNGANASFAYMFDQCALINSISLTNVGNGNVSSFTYMFNKNASLVNVTMDNVAMGTNELMSYMFQEVATNSSTVTTKPVYRMNNVGVGGGSNLDYFVYNSFSATTLYDLGAELYFLADDPKPVVGLKYAFALYNNAIIQSNQGDQDVNPCHLTKMDMRGLPGITKSGLASGSNNTEGMFMACDTIKKVGYTDDCDLRLPDNWDLSGNNSMQYMFVGLFSCTEITFNDCCTSPSVNMFRMFRSGRVLKKVTLGSTGKPIGSSNNLGGLFSYCNVLEEIDLTGIGTSLITFTSTSNETGNMNQVFFQNPSSSVGIYSTSGKVTIGPAFTNVSRGFFNYTNSTSPSSAHTLKCPIYVYGGPSSTTGLVLQSQSGSYTGTIQLMDADAIANGHVWRTQGYTTNPSTGTSPSADQYIGAADDGQSGHSVQWSIANSTLTISATNGVSGKMRDFGNNAATLAPWNSLASSTNATSFNKVVVTGSITAPANLTQMFYGCTALTSGDLRNLKFTSATTSLFRMFYGCTALTTVGYSDANGIIMPDTSPAASSIQNVSQMFYGCTNLTGVALHNMANANSTDFTLMFQNATKISYLELANFANGNNADLRGTFQARTALRTVVMDNVGNGTTGADLAYLFARVNNLQTATLSNVGKNADLSFMLSESMTTTTSGTSSKITLTNVGYGGTATNLFRLMYGNTYLYSVSLNKVGSAPNAEMTDLVRGCIRMHTVTMDDVGVGANTSLTYALYGSAALVNLNLTNVGSGAGADLTRMVSSSSTDATLITGYQSYNLTNVGNGGGAILTETFRDSIKVSNYGCGFTWRNVDLAQYRANGDTTAVDPQPAATMYQMFRGCTYLNWYNMPGVPNISQRYTTATPSVEGMFQGCTYLSSANSKADWDLSAAVSLANMYYGCASFGSLNMSSIRIGIGVDMSHMFDGCTGLTSLIWEYYQNDTDLVGSAVNMEGMFQGCSNLTMVNIAGVGTGSLTGEWDADPLAMKDMFKGCTKLLSTARNATTVIIGAKTTKVLNGFVGQRTGSAAWEYVLASMIQIKDGGPTSTDYLMQRPGGYNADIEFVNPGAFANADIWFDRDYFSYKNAGLDPSGADLYGDFVESGYLGYTGTHEGRNYDGTSVMWMIRHNATTNVSTLVIYAKDGTSGLMRDMGQTAATYSPWCRPANIERSASFQNVVVNGAVTAHGSLENMFNGCTTLVNADLRSLIVTPATRSVYQMFYQATGFASFGYAPESPHGQVSGIVIPDGSSDTQPAWDMTGISNAARMFSGCDKLASLAIDGLADGTEDANLSYLAYQCKSLVRVDMDNVGTGDGANLSYMFSQTAYDATHVPTSVTSVLYDFNEFGTGARANFEAMFYNSFHAPQVATANGEIRFAAEAAQGATNYKQMFAGTSTSYIRKIDIRGLGGLSPIDTVEASMLSMFAYCARLASVGYNPSVASGLILSTSWDLTNAANMSYMFQNCSQITSVDFRGACVAPSVDMSYMFSGCSAMTNCSLGSSAMQIPTGSAYKMSYMFQNCSKLNSLDMRGIGTSEVRGNYLAYGEKATYMYNMFSGATQITSKTSTSKITIGFGFTKVLNGFFWNKTSLDATSATYVINSNVDIVEGGGPDSTTYLMERPMMTNYTYTGIINFVGAASWAKREVWAGREYLNYARDGRDITGYVYGNVVEYGYVGHDGFYEGVEYDGTSVTWAVRESTAGVKTLVLYPTDGEYGVLRDLGTNESNWAPWNYNYSNTTALNFTRAVVFNPIKAYGNLAQMFYGCANMKDCDLKRLEVADGTTSVYQMFYGCTSITSAGMGYVGRDLLVQSGVILPMDANGVGTWNTPNMTLASQMFSSCTSMTTVDIRELANGDHAVLSAMFNNCTSLTSVSLTNVGQGTEANLSRMLAGITTLNTINLTNVGTGDNTDLSYMCSQDHALVNANLNNVGTGYRAQMQYMFEQVAYTMRSTSSSGSVQIVEYVPNGTNLSYVFTDVGIGGESNLSNMFRNAFNANAFKDSARTVSLTWRAENEVKPCATLENMFNSEAFVSSDREYLYNHLTNIVLTGLPGVMKSNQSGGSEEEATTIRPSTSKMFYYLDRITTIGSSTTDSVVFAKNWEVSEVEDMTYMFAKCTALTRVVLSDLCTAPSVDMSYMFANDAKLTRVALTKSASGAEIGSVSLMRYMFQSCSALDTIDLTGIGTSNITGEVEGRTEALSGMWMMFSGASKITAATSNVSTIAIGPAFAKVLNGFFYNRTNSDAVNYTIQSKISVYGGPSNPDNLMVRPSITGGDYQGTINLSDDTAWSRVGVWVKKDYLNIEHEGVDVSGMSYGTLVTGGLIGYEGEFNDATWDGTSVSWAIRQKSTAKRLIIYPTDGKYGLMKDFGSSAETNAPWTSNVNADRAASFNRVYVALGRVEAHGDLNQMFYGNELVGTFDLRRLKVTNRTGSMYQMFYNCMAATSVNYQVSVEAGMGETSVSGIVLPKNDNYIKDAAWDTSGLANAVSMFAGCANMTSLNLSDFGNGDGCEFTEMFAGCTRMATVNLANVANGDDTDLTAMFRGREYLSSATFNTVGTGRNANLTEMFTQCYRLVNVNFTDVGSGEGAILTRMMSEVAKTNHVYSGSNHVKTEYLPASTAVTLNYTLTDVGTGGGARFDQFFYNSFNATALSLAASNATVTFALRSGTTALPAATLAQMFNPWDGSAAVADYYSYLRKIDVRGLPSLSTFNDRTTGEAIDPSMFAMFRNCIKITSVGYSTSDTLILPSNWDLSKTTSVADMFRNCTAITKAELKDFCTSSSVSMNEMFRSCTNLVTCSMTSTFDEGGPAVGSTNDMRYMFASCTKLTTIDFTGVGTSNVTGIYSDTSEQGTYMFNMFSGATQMVSNTSGDKRITIGKSFTKVIDGFFGCKNASGTPTYVIYANVYVYGGPTNMNNLMQRPEHETYNYAGTIFFQDADAWDHRKIWLDRNYLNFVYMTDDMDLGQEYGDLQAGGLIGHTGMYDGDEYDGTSVSWAIRKNMTTSVSTLVIYATNGQSGLMRDMGSSASALAPWNSLANANYATAFTQVVVVGDVRAHGSLTQMFYGCSAMRSADLRNLNVTQATESMYEMFRGCTALTKTIYNSESEKTSPALFTDGLIMNGAWDTSGVVSATSMFYGCSSLTETSLNNFANRANADLKAMYQGCSKLTSVTITDSANAANISMESMFQGLTALVNVNLNNVGNADNVSFYQMFTGCTRINTVILEDIGKGSFINMGRMFKGAFRTAPGANAAARLDMVDSGNGQGINMFEMFMNCTYLRNVTIDHCGNGADANLSYMFSTCQYLTRVTASSFGTGARTILSYTFNKVATANNATYLPANTQSRFTMTDVGVGGGSRLDYMFYGSFTATNLKASSGGSTTITFASKEAEPKPIATMRGMFAAEESTSNTEVNSANYISRIDLRGIADLATGSFEDSTVSLKSMFEGCDGMVTVGYNDTDSLILPTGWDLSQVDSMYSMFRGCATLSNVILQDFCTSPSLDMNRMFRACPALTDVSIIRTSDGPNIGSCADMRSMFSNCPALLHVNLSGVGTSELTGVAASSTTYLYDYGTAEQMWFGCTKMLGDKTSSFTIGPAFSNFTYPMLVMRGSGGTISSYFKGSLYVYGGPSGLSGLIECPSTYTKQSPLPVYLLDQTAQSREQIWIDRKYIATETSNDTLMVVNFNADWEEWGITGEITPQTQTRTFNSQTDKVRANVTNPIAYGYEGTGKWYTREGSPDETYYVDIEQYDAEGNPIYETGSDGLPLPKKDDFGNIIYKRDAHGNLIQMTDGAGNLIFEEEIVYVTDQFGQPVMVDKLDEDGNPIYVYLFDEHGDPIYVIQKDEEGNPMFDEVTGDPIYERDSHGNLIQEREQALNDEGDPLFDEDGNPVWATEKEQKTETIQKPVYEPEYQIKVVQEERRGYRYTEYTFGGTPVGGTTLNLYCMPDTIHYNIEFVNLVVGSGQTNSNLGKDVDFDDPYTLPSLGTGTGEVNFTAPSGYAFLGWTVGPEFSGSYSDPDLYMPGESVKRLAGYQNQTISVYAQWLKLPVVTFYMDNKLLDTVATELRRAEPVAPATLGRVASTYIPADRFPSNELQTGGKSDSSWCKDAACNTRIWRVPVTEEQNVASSCSVYRRIDAAKFTITYNNGYNPAIANSYTSSFSFGYPVTLQSSQFSRTGYRFSGWAFTAEDALAGRVALTDRKYISATSTELIERADETNNIDLYAVWTLLTYRVSFALDDGAFTGGYTPPSTYTVLDLPIEIPDPVKDGYTFSGWAGSNGRAPQASYSIPANTTGDLSYQAHWETLKYKITYELKGGAFSAADTRDLVTSYTPETATINVPRPTRTGYNFTGWVGTGLDAPTLDLTIPVGSSGNRTYTATWSTIEYSITYNLGAGAKWPEGYEAPTTYNVESPTFVLQTAPVREGYTFLGFTGSNGSVANKQITVTSGTTGNLSYVASWQVRTFSLGFELNATDATWAGTSWATTQPRSYTYTTSSIVVPEPTRPNYRFGGWIGGTEDDQLETPVKRLVIAQGSEGDRYYRAIWVRGDYRVDFYLNYRGYSQDDVPTSIFVPAAAFDVAKFTLPDAYYQYHALAGWSGRTTSAPDSPDVMPIDTELTIADLLTKNVAVIEEPVEGSDMPLSVITLSAIWADGEAQVNFVTFGGVNPAPATYHIGTGLDANYMLAFEPTWTTNNMYMKFAGWYTDPTYRGKEVKEIGTNARTDITLYAKWTYDIELTEISGSDFATASVFKKIPDITWYPTGEYVNQIDMAGVPSTSKNADGTLNIPWWTLTNEIPSMVGMRFVGWSTAPEQLEPLYLQGQRMTANMTPDAMGQVKLYSQWEARTYTVSFSSGLDETEYPITGMPSPPYLTATYGRNWTIPVGVPTMTKPEYEYYRFAGWEAYKGGVTYTYSPGENVRDILCTGEGTDVAIELTAKWIWVDHMVLFDGNGGNIKSGAQGYIALETDNVTLKREDMPFERAGYVFKGWNTKADGTGRTFLADGTDTESFAITSVTGGSRYITLYAMWQGLDYTVRFLDNITEYDSITGEVIAYYTDPFAEITANIDGGQITIPGQDYANKTPEYQDAELVNSWSTFTGWSVEPDGIIPEFIQENGLPIPEHPARVFAKGEVIGIDELFEALEDARIDIDHENRVIDLYAQWDYKLSFSVPTEVPINILRGTAESEPTIASIQNLTPAELRIVSLDATDFSTEGMSETFLGATPAQMRTVAIVLSDEESVPAKVAEVYLGQTSAITPGFVVPASDGETPTYLPLVYTLKLSQAMGALTYEAIGNEQPVATLVYTVEASK